MKIQSFLLLLLTCILLACTAPTKQEEVPVTEEKETTSLTEELQLDEEAFEEMQDKVNVKSNTKNSSYFIKNYEGSIDGKYNFQMKLTHSPEGYTGEYFYEGKKEKITLYQDDKSKETIILEELVKGKKTGEFEFTITNQDKISGTWSNDKNKLPFEMKAMPQGADPEGWTGDWYYNSPWDSGTMVIGNITDNSFDIFISAVVTGHLAYLDASATYSGKKAKISFTEYDDICEIELTHEGNQIQVNQLSSTLACGFGARAYVTGNYEKEDKEVLAELEAGEEVFLRSEAELNTVKQILGEHYHDFAFRMLAEDDYKTTDDFIEEAANGGVWGFGAAYSAVIAKGKDQYYLAYFDYDENDNLMLYYFSNNTEYKEKLPSTIKTWADEMDETYTVKFH